MTNDDTPAPHEGAPEHDSTQEGQRVDDASGQKVGPPGQGDLDAAKLDEAKEDLEKAGGGH
jgi:hypothetical protein